MTEDLKRVALLGGPTSQLASVVGLDRELIIDTDKKTLTVHDGETPGGFPLLREDGPGDAVTVRGRTLDDRAGEVANVLDFGAVGDGETDDAPAFQQAIDHLVERGGGVLRVPAGGYYRLEDDLTCADVPLAIEADGSSVAQLLIVHSGHGLHYTATTTNVVQSGPGAGRLKSLRLTNVSFVCSASTALAAVRGEWPAETSALPLFTAQNVLVGHVPLTGGLSHGLWLTNASGTVMNNVRVLGSAQAVAPTQADCWTMRYGILLDSSGNVAKLGHYWNGVRVSYANWGTWVDGWYEGIYATNCELGPNTAGLRLTNGASPNTILAAHFANLHVDVRANGVEINGAQDVKFANLEVLRNTSGFDFDGSGVSATDVQHLGISGGWINCSSPSGVEENGIIVAGTSLSPKVSGVSIIGAKTAGVAFSGVVSSGSFDGHVQDCGTSVILGPSASGNRFSFSEANSGAASDSGADNRVNLTGYALGNQAPIAGVKMQVDNLLEAGSQKVEDIAGIWSGITYAHTAASRTFDSTTAGGTTAGSPVATTFTYAVNDGCPADVVAGIDVAIAKASNSTVFGRNIIAGNVSGTTNTKIVGLEVDVQPTTGTTVNSGTGGVYINAFNLPGLGPALQVGGVGGGSFTNGIVLGGGVSGAGFSGASGASMTSLINSGGATYSAAAIVLSNGHKLRLSGTGSAHAYSYTDGSNNRREVLGGGGFIWRNNADTVSLVSIDSGGNLNLEAGGELRSGGTSVVDPNRLICLRSYTVATLPSASVAGKEIYVSNESGGAVPAFADGTNWRRVTDRAVVS
ncbi:glycosyl hydrolase family 28-related protein [Azospirillum tabaci]|uniref:glycosyl hydrolase family 28-related protein n=1 Tax=Azospirillum tabaci TaxID=2752310 RepID=UPI001660FA24|nr:glycosyl hydrolase family 28-related protein [Azospirillum tabaci]